MKEYCVDLKLAKELKENRFPQETHFYFAKMLKYATSTLTTKEKMDRWKYVSKEYSAPTSDEILKELPTKIKVCKDEKMKLIIEKIGNNYFPTYYIDFVDYAGYEDCATIGEFKDKKLANALAKMWLYLKKEGYLK